MDSSSSLNAKLGGWVALYTVGMISIGLRIFARTHLFGSLTSDDWLMIGAGVAYTGGMITEIFVFLAYRSVNILEYIKVRIVLSSQLSLAGC